MARSLARKRSWLIVAIACICSYSISAGIRLLEYQKWNYSFANVRGEHILATNDAYAWVAGASELSTSTSRSSMAALLRGASQILRLYPAEIAFWAPPFLSSLVAIPLVLWSSLLRAPGAAVLIATVGSLAPAYFRRTRLGYYDTDWAT